MEKSKRGRGGEAAHREGTSSPRPRPARCSKTRWRVDGEATGAERASCSLGYRPIKAGMLHFTQDHEAAATSRKAAHEQSKTTFSLRQVRDKRPRNRRCTGQSSPQPVPVPITLSLYHSQREQRRIGLRVVVPFMFVKRLSLFSLLFQICNYV